MADYVRGTVVPASMARWSTLRRTVFFFVRAYSVARIRPSLASMLGFNSGWN